MSKERDVLRQLHVLVDGPSGSGKTTLVDFFKSQGKIAIDADTYPGLAMWVDKNGNRKRPGMLTAEQSELVRRGDLKWNGDRNRLQELLTQNGDKELYIFGETYNLQDFIDLFDKKYYLQTDTTLLLKRLKERAGRVNGQYHVFGTTEEERDIVIRSLDSRSEQARRLGFVFIDASISPRRIYNLIVGKIPEVSK